MKEKNILVIENQQCEFDCISSFLKHEFNLYPSSVTDFVSFINHVHVALNTNYEPEYRRLALKKINDIADGIGDPFGNQRPVDLILMDHILGGAHYCHTGIDLANYLNINRQLNPIPVVFLSRTPQDHKTKLEGNCTDNKSFNLSDSSLDKMGYEKDYNRKYPNSSRWVHKGYFGEDSLDDTDLDNDTKCYFNKYVLTAIKEIIPLAEREALLNIITDILGKYTFSTNENFIKQKLDEIKVGMSQGMKYTDAFKDWLLNKKAYFSMTNKYKTFENQDIIIINEQYNLHE